ncbi:MAG TPA: hypothetical protein PLS46_12105 [Microthrixaceae bacterium]|nr:hypothetical protein [Microthrixaceae bacterium]
MNFSMHLSGRRVSRWLVAPAVALLVATGCGKESSGSEDSATVVEFGNRQYGDASSSPLTKYFGYDDTEKLNASAREQNKKAERAIAECMHAEGFEYIPNLTAGNFAAAPEIDLTQREYAEKWGFGITTTMQADGSPVEDAPGMASFDDTASQDPNQAIVDGMSDSERAAYEQALYGASISSDMGDDGSGDGSEVDVPDGPPEGCQSKAYGSDAEPSEAAQKMDELYNDLSKRITADRRTKAATKEYRSCMADAGYPSVKTVDDVYEVMNKKAEELYAALSGDIGNSDVSASDDGSDEGGDDTSSAVTTVSGSGDGSTSTGIDPDKLAAVQKYERKLAVAELPCRAEYQAAYEKVSAEYEQEFIDDNKSTLDEVKAEVVG